MPSNSRRILVFLLLWPLVAAGISFVAAANFFGSILLFFGIPVAVLALHNRRMVRRAFLFAVSFGVISAIAIDYVMEATGGWYVPESVFGDIRILGLVTIDILFWMVGYILYVLLFYGTFLDAKPGNARAVGSARLKYLATGSVTAFLAFLALHAWATDLLIVEQLYWKWALVLVLGPLAAVLVRNPRLFVKLLITTSYFAWVTFVYELTALALGQWSFPATDQHIGTVSIGTLSFPFEELVFWILLGGAGVISYYELFDDDGR